MDIDKKLKKIMDIDNYFRDYEKNKIEANTWMIIRTAGNTKEFNDNPQNYKKNEIDTWGTIRTAGNTKEFDDNT